MSPRARILFVMMLIALVGGGFYLRLLSKRVLIEAPLHAEEAARAKLSQFELQSNHGSTQSATLYFPRLNEGKLIPERRYITWAETDTDRVRQVILALAEGSQQGLGRVLPASTTVRAVFLTAEGTAYVDLPNEALSELEPGIQSETLALYSLVNSITMNIPSVKKVQFLIQGQQVEALDGHADLTSAFTPDLTRIKSGP
jgi:hypothetical protein